MDTAVEAGEYDDAGIGRGFGKEVWICAFEPEDNTLRLRSK